MAGQGEILARMAQRGMAAAASAVPAAKASVLPEILPAGFGRLVERAVHASADLVVQARRENPTAPHPAEVGALLVPGALGLPLLGPSGTVEGLLVLDPVFVSALVEAQISGGLSSRAPAERAATEVDAALCEGFAEVLAADLAGTLPALGRLRTGPALFDAHLAVLQLPEDGLRRAAWALDIGPGQRTGAFSVVLVTGQSVGQGGAASSAVPSAEAVPAGPKLDKAVVSAVGAAGREAAVFDRALMAPGEGRMSLRAVLVRQPLSLAALASLRPGDVLPLPLARLQGVTLEAVDDSVVARACLGARDGFRAVCVSGSDLQAEPGADTQHTREDLSTPGSFAQLPLATGTEHRTPDAGSGQVRAA